MENREALVTGRTVVQVLDVFYRGALARLGARVLERGRIRVVAAGVHDRRTCALVPGPILVWLTFHETMLPPHGKRGTA
ncbi:MAG: hypothetical protein NVS3B7_14490 [Candidatus Elarobacter sp.]